MDDFMKLFSKKGLLFTVLGFAFAAGSFLISGMKDEAAYEEIKSDLKQELLEEFKDKK